MTTEIMQLTIVDDRGANRSFVYADMAEELFNAVCNDPTVRYAEFGKAHQEPVNRYVQGGEFK
jgi:hypothetical protein